jgi:hypothetical protein
MSHSAESGCIEDAEELAGLAEMPAIRTQEEEEQRNRNSHNARHA